MYRVEARLALLALIVAIASLLAAVPVGAVVQGVLVGEAGPFDVYRVGGYVFYAAVDPGNFDYVYNGRLFVVRYHSADEAVFRVSLTTSLPRLLAGGAAGAASPSVVYPVAGVGSGGLLEELEALGVGAVLARVLALEDAGVTWVEVLVPEGRGAEALAAAGAIREAVARHAGGGSVDFVVVVEGLWPEGLSFNEITELAARASDTLVSRGVPLASVGGSHGIALVFGVDGIRLREAGMSEEDVLKAIDEALPRHVKAVVEFYYYNQAETRGVGVEEEPKLLGGGGAWLAFALAVGLAALSALAAAAALAKRGP